MRQGAIIAAIALGLASATGAAAQNYPERLVQIIVPATPGSSADILGRVLADGMSTQFGKPVIVVNKPGANGVLGTADVARANPDGYILMHGATYSVTVQPLTDKDAGYTLKSFTADLPDLQERPGHRGAAEFAAEDGERHRRGGEAEAGCAQCRHSRHRHHPAPRHDPACATGQGRVQRRAIQGAGRGNPDTRSGQLDFSAVPLTAAAGSGLTMPGLFAATRNPSLPDVPTFKEQGYDVAPLSFGGLSVRPACGGCYA